MNRRKVRSHELDGSTPAPRGLTLMELLGVIVILALVTGSVMVNLGSMDRAVKLDELGGQIQRLDRAARMLARTEGDAMIELRERQLVLLIPNTGEVMQRIAIKGGWQVQLRDSNERTVNTITYDANGRSRDVFITLHDDDRSRGFIIHGLTGLVHRQEEPAP